MQLNFLEEDIGITPQESKRTVASKNKKNATASADLFDDLPLTTTPKKITSKVLQPSIEKSETAFKTISEVADVLSVPQHVLRFWESRFSQIKPLKMGGGRRYYRPEDIDIISKIHNLLYKQGYTIKGAKKVFMQKNEKPTEVVTIARKTSLLTDKQRKQVSTILQELLNLRETLRPYLANTALT